MEDIIQADIHDGKSVKAWKEPGLFTLEFYPLVSIRIAEDQMDDVVKDLEKIIKKIKNSS